MQSMTGYGRARACRDGREITIELKTVNHRFLDLSFRMPKNLTFLEDVLRERINKSALKRGHVDVFVTYANTRADAREVRVDAMLLEAFGQALKGAEEALDPYRRMTAAEALTLSGALTITQAEEDAAREDEASLEELRGGDYDDYDDYDDGDGEDGVFVRRAALQSRRDEVINEPDSSKAALVLAPDALPPLALSKTSPEQIDLCLRAWRDPAWQVVFD